jgi:hypothetical protein
MPLAGSGQAIAINRASGTGSLALTGSSAAKLPIAASSSGSLALAGSSNTAVLTHASASGDLPLTGSAATISDNTANVAGALDLTGKATSSVSVNAASSGALELSGAGSIATVALALHAEANGLLVLAGSANVRNKPRAGSPGAPLPVRRQAPAKGRIPANSPGEMKFTVRDTPPIRTQKLELLRQALSVTVLDDVLPSTTITNHGQDEGPLTPLSIPRIDIGKVVETSEGSTLQLSEAVPLVTVAWQAIGDGQSYTAEWRARVTESVEDPVSLDTAMFIYSATGIYLGEYARTVQDDTWEESDGWLIATTAASAADIRKAFPRAAYVRAALIPEGGEATKQVARGRVFNASTSGGAEAFAELARVRAEAAEVARLAAEGAASAAQIAQAIIELAEANTNAALALAQGARDAARDAEASAIDQALAAANSASVGAGYAQTTITKADEAAGSASIATAQALVAQGHSDEAGTRAIAAATSADAAEISNTEAASSASAAQLDRVAAESAREEADTFASAAALHEQTAGTYATDAESFAGAAQVSQTNAATSAGEASDSAGAASTSAGQASTSESNAAGSAATASEQAGLAATARNAAGESASASADSASVATAQADAAGQSALAANASKIAANTARSGAEAAQAITVSARDTALGAEASAVSASQLAVSSSTRSKSNIQTYGMTPNATFVDSMDSWSLTNGSRIVGSAEYGVRARLLAQGELQSLHRHPVNPNRVYEVKANYNILNQPQESLIGLACFDVAGTLLGRIYAPSLGGQRAPGAYQVSQVFTGTANQPTFFGDSTKFIIGTATVQPIFIGNRNSVSGGITDVRWVYLDDVTERVLSEAAASIAETARISASQDAAAAEASRVLAAAAKTEAENASGDAAGFAATASNAASDSASAKTQAEGAASIATSQKELAVSARGSAEAARDTALGYRDTTLGYRDAANQHRAEAALSASQAATSKVDAESAEAVAISNAQLSAAVNGARGGYQVHFQRDGLLATRQYTANLSVDVAPVLPGNGVSFYNDQGYGRAILQSAAADYIRARQYIPIRAGAIYRIRGTLSGSSDSTGSSRIGLACYNAGGSYAGFYSGVFVQSANTSGPFQTYEFTVTAGEIRGAIGNADYIALAWAFNIGGAGSTAFALGEIEEISALKSLEASVTVNQAAVATLQSASALYEVIVAASGSNPAMVQLLAGLGGSKVGIVADTFAVGNKIDGIIKEVIRVRNGQAEIESALIRKLLVPPRADSAINMLVELAPIIVSGSHGQTIDYQGGASFGSAPLRIEPVLEDLPALATGEKWTISTQKFGSGFIPSVTKTGPGSYTSHNAGNSRSQAGTPQYVADKTQAEPSYNRRYVFSTLVGAAVTQTVEEGINRYRYRAEGTLYAWVGGTLTAVGSYNAEWQSDGAPVSASRTITTLVDVGADLGARSPMFGAHPTVGSLGSLAVSWETSTAGAPVVVNDTIRWRVYAPART